MLEIAAVGSEHGHGLRPPERAAGRVIANQPHHLGGAIDAARMEKAASFIRRCDAFGLSLVVLVDTPDSFRGRSRRRKWRDPARRRLLHAFSAARVPKVTVVLRKAYGGGFITMNSRALGRSWCFAWRAPRSGSSGRNRRSGSSTAAQSRPPMIPRPSATGSPPRHSEEQPACRGRRGRRGRRRSDRTGGDPRASGLGALGAGGSRTRKEALMDIEARRRRLAGAAALLRWTADRDAMESSGRT